MHSVVEILDELLRQVDYVPALAIKFCCKDGKVQTLSKILEHFPNIAADGSAMRNSDDEVVASDASDSTAADLFEAS